MRKEAFSIGIGTPADIIDGGCFEPEVEQLQANQLRQITMRLPPTSVDDGTTSGCPFHLQSDFLADLEGGDTNVRADRCDECRRIGGKLRHRARDDARYRTAPSCMNR